MNKQLECKIEFDESIRELNKVLRYVRGAALHHEEVQPLHEFAHAAGNMLNHFGGQEQPRYSDAVYAYARMIEEVAFRLRQHEHDEPCPSCPVAGAVLQQLVFPVLISISCVAAGFDLARGRDMNLEVEDDT